MTLLNQGRRDFMRTGAAAMMGSLLFGPLCRADEQKPGPVVETPYGKLRGLSAGEVVVFKGVHYGATTAGDGRFAPPQPPVSWPGVKDAYEYGPTTPQPGKVNPPMSEDCLVLNVWTPSADSGRRPVMVWFHGGGFSGGSGSLPVFDGSRLAAAQDVVVVTLNHRLGALGFLYLDELSGGRVRTGNLGLLDLAAALRWVKQSISAFGGDQNNVTIFGESGGGRKVATFSAMPVGSGLYQRMIIQSGPATRQLTADRANQCSEAFLTYLGVGPSLDSLRSLPLEKIMAAQAAVDAPMTMPVDNVIAGFAPVVDGVTLSARRIFRYRAGNLGWYPHDDWNVPVGAGCDVSHRPCSNGPQIDAFGCRGTAQASARIRYWPHRSAVHSRLPGAEPFRTFLAY